MRGGWLVAGASLLALAAPGVARAHVRIGTLAVDIRVRVSSSQSPAPGAFAASVSEGARALHVTVRENHQLVVLGYLGEPFLRVDGRGAAVNLGSPTAASAGLVRTRAAAERVDWSLRSGGRTVVWRDPRVYELVLAAGGAGFAIWGPLEVRVAAAGWLGLLGLIGGLACGQVFLHGVVLSVLPATLTRVAAALGIALGAASAVLAGLYYASPSDALSAAG